MLDQRTLTLTFMKDCDETFRSSEKLVRHNLLEHSDDVLKPSLEPFRPRLPALLPPVPDILPAYMVEPRAVRPAPISPDRHILLGQWVSSLLNAFYFSCARSDLNTGSAQYLRTSRCWLEKI